MISLRHIELTNLKKLHKLIKDNIYVTEQGMFKALSDRSFNQYKNALGPKIVISAIKPTDPDYGDIWIDIS